MHGKLEKLQSAACRSGTFLRVWAKMKPSWPDFDVRGRRRPFDGDVSKIRVNFYLFSTKTVDMAARLISFMGEECHPCAIYFFEAHVKSGWGRNWRPITPRSFTDADILFHRDHLTDMVVRTSRNTAHGRTEVAKMEISFPFQPWFHLRTGKNTWSYLSYSRNILFRNSKPLQVSRIIWPMLDVGFVTPHVPPSIITLYLRLHSYLTPAFLYVCYPSVIN